MMSYTSAYPDLSNIVFDERFVPDQYKQYARDQNQRSRSVSPTSANNYGTSSSDSRVTSNGVYMSHCYFSSTHGNPVRSVIG